MTEDNLRAQLGPGPAGQAGWPEEGRAVSAGGLGRMLTALLLLTGLTVLAFMLRAVLQRREPRHAGELAEDSIPTSDNPAETEAEPPPTGDGPEVPAGLTAGQTTAPHKRGFLSIISGYLLSIVIVLVGLVFLALVVGPMLLPYRLFTVATGSMAPTLPVGSVIVLRPVDSSAVKIGDIITFHRPDNPAILVTHRVMAIEDQGGQPVFVTKGDANGTPDAWRVPATDKGWRYAFTIPYLGPTLDFFSSTTGRALLIGVPLVALALLGLAWLWRVERAPPLVEQGKLQDAATTR